MAYQTQLCLHPHRISPDLSQSALSRRILTPNSKKHASCLVELRSLEVPLWQIPEETEKCLCRPEKLQEGNTGHKFSGIVGDAEGNSTLLPHSTANSFHQLNPECKDRRQTVREKSGLKGGAPEEHRAMPDYQAWDSFILQTDCLPSPPVWLQRDGKYWMHHCN